MNAIETPWMTLGESSAYAKRGKRSLSRAVANGDLRAARVGGRRELLFLREWLDAWLEAQARPVLVTRRMTR